MLSILISWVVIFFVVFSAGDFFVSFANKALKRNEVYNITDTFILGLCFVAVLLTIIAFALPVNDYVLLFFIAASILYWLLARKRFGYHCRAVINLRKEISASTVGVLLLLFLAFLLYATYAPILFDPEYYHYQNIIWIEKYPVIPGLGNVEDRLGFNSYVMPLYALFSMHTFLGSYVFSLQLLLILLMMFWLVVEIQRSRFGLTRILLLFLFFVLIFTDNGGFSNTSSDVIPNIVFFYIMARILLRPNTLSGDYLFYILVPVAMVAFKLSAALLCIVSLYLLYTLIRKHDYRLFTLFILLSGIVVLPWLVRNVIISGYLVYPVYEVDLFSVDWKMPLRVAQNQRQYAAAIANGEHWYRLLRMLKMIFVSHTYIEINKIYYLQALAALSGFAAMGFSICLLLYRKIRAVKVDSYQWLVFITILFSFVFWFVSARDYRFGNGILMAAVFFGVTLLFPRYSFRKAVGITLSYAVAVSIFIHSICWISVYIDIVRIILPNENPYSTALCKPYSIEEKKKAFDLSNVEKYEIKDGVYFYVSPRDLWGGCTFDMIPGVGAFDAVSRNVDIRGLEMRGDDIRQGFRLKSDSINSYVK